ncbi:hypothetical protein [Streptacidiphilus anmyonensis]|uniref:hypothetical protein n=1 Tax=Streptacidiphilus anmyonensis TaxID=405782 RepID=UPI0005A97A8B|nr:hypothetical protein [Streptacidiphilus anmyonensis]
MDRFLVKSDLGTLEGGVPESGPILDLIKSIAVGELTFLVIQLASSAQVYIQAFLEAEGLCLEHREGGADAHFESRGVAIEQAHSVMMSWVRGTAGWRTDVIWEKLVR